MDSLSSTITVPADGALKQENEENEEKETQSKKKVEPKQEEWISDSKSTYHIIPTLACNINYL